jgi:hypothetical protein
MPYKNGDIVSVGTSKIRITEIRDGKIYSFKPVKTTIIPFKPDFSLKERQDLVKQTMQEHLPIDLISVKLIVGSKEFEYGFDEHLNNAERIILTYTK